MIHLSLISPPHLVPTSCSLLWIEYLNWVSANQSEANSILTRISSEKSSYPSSHTHTHKTPTLQTNNQKIPKLGFETERGFPQFHRGGRLTQDTRKSLATAFTEKGYARSSSNQLKNDDDILPTNEHIFQRADSNDLVLPNPNIRFTAVKQCNKIVLTRLHISHAQASSPTTVLLLSCVCSYRNK